MRILALDSSGLTATIAVVEEAQTVAEYTVNYKKTHSQTLLPMLDEVAKMIELDLDTIDAIAGLGLAIGKPLIHIPTVDGLAYNLYGCKGVICPMMDARRNQVYTGIYRFEEEFETVVPQEAVAVSELVEQLNQLGEAVTFLGDGVPVYEELLREGLKVPYRFAPPHLNRQRAAAVGTLAMRYLREGRTETAAEHEPDYLRVSQAERERAEREGKNL